MVDYIGQNRGITVQFPLISTDWPFHVPVGWKVFSGDYLLDTKAPPLLKSSPSQGSPRRHHVTPLMKRFITSRMTLTSASISPLTDHNLWPPPAQWPRVGGIRAGVRGGVWVVKGVHGTWSDCLVGFRQLGQLPPEPVAGVGWWVTSGGQCLLAMISFKWPWWPFYGSRLTLRSSMPYPPWQTALIKALSRYHHNPSVQIWRWTSRIIH